MERLDKYMIIKTQDADKYLSDEMMEVLISIKIHIARCRVDDGREFKKNYVVVSETLPFYEETWRKIEDYVDKKKG